MRNNLKKILAVMLALVALFTFGLSASAADTTDIGTGTVTGNVTVTGSLSSLIISVTHPLTVGYIIDPNSGTTGFFGAPDITIKNNTKVPIKVTVDSLSAAPGGTLVFTDVESNSKTWNTLNLDDSKKYIALGIKTKDATGWNAGYSIETHWAVKTTRSLIGTLNPTMTGTLNFTANFGLAFDASYTAKHNVVFLFQLA